MKILLILPLLFLLFLISCGDKDTFTTNQYSEYEIDGNVTLDASMKYSPNRHYDGVITVEEGRDYTIPEYISVIYGNAGRYTAQLSFGDVVCLYKGGSSLARPLTTTNQTEIAKGQSYEFVSCSDLSGPNTQIYLESGEMIVLHVVFGDRTVPTRVRANLGLQ